MFALGVTLLLVASTATAGSVNPMALHKPPFKGTPLLDVYTHAHGCGSVANFSTYPVFNMSSGIGRMGSTAKATGCGLLNTDDDAVTEGMFGFVTTPGLVAVGSEQNYSMNSSFNVSWTLNATPGSPAGGPFAWASLSLIFHAGLVDLDNKSVLLGGCSGYIFGNTTNGTKTGLVVGSFGFRCDSFPTHWIAHVVPGHHNAIEFTIQIVSFAHTPAGTKTHATAKFNLATLGHKFQVVSWGYL